MSVLEDLSHTTIARGDKAPVRGSVSPSWTPYRSFLKRGLDILVVVVLSVVVVPLVAVLALMIASSGGSPFYTQTRVGRDGRTFRLVKLRSMVPDAEALLEERLQTCPDSLAEWTRTQKLKNDPRVTPLGRVLRKTSLDELPQLLNVLVGDMSLVGPRPMMVCQQDMYPGSAYYRLRPGISGFWQISDRNECSFAARAEFDDAYDRKLSLGTDLRVLVATVGVVLRGTGY